MQEVLDARPTCNRYLEGRIQLSSEKAVHSTESNFIGEGDLKKKIEKSIQGN